MKYLSILFCVLLALLPVSALAARFALVIGINDYENVPKLEKAVGDAEAMGAKLTSLGFTVTPVLNPDRRALNQAIATFTRQVKPGDDVLVHFSGHGVELDGNNLLLPADVPSPGSDDKDFLIGEAISLSDLMQRIADTHAATRLFIIDACRDNPFASNGTKGLGGTRGLAMEVPTAGAFILYSAGKGQTALDRLGPSDPETTSVYTRVLVEMLGTPGMSLTDLAKGVRKKVAALADSVSHSQQPAYYDELGDDFYFAAGTGSTPPPQPQNDTTTPPATDTAQRDYADAKAVDSAEAWTAFLKYHPTGYYADLAKAALTKLTASVPTGVSTADVRELIAYISSDEPSKDLSNFVQGTYASRVDYYGKLYSRAQVLSDKQTWYARWSRWSVRPRYDTLVVEPQGTDEYAVSYVLDYTWYPVSSAKQTLTGTAKERLTVAKVDGKLVILYENSDLVTEAPPAEEKPVAVASLGPLDLEMPDVDGNYFIFLGAFKAQDGAETKRRQLGSLASRADIIWTSDYVGLTRDLWAAAIGPLSRDEAAETLASARLTAPDAYVRQTRQKSEPAATDNVYYLVGLVPTGDNWLALRTSPDTSGERIAKMGPTTLLRVISRSGDWNQVEVLNTTLRGARGWSSRKYMACCL